MARGYGFAVLAPVCEDLYWQFSLRPVLHLSCVLPAYVAHTVCLSAVSVMDFINLVRRNLRTHRSSSRSSMLSLSWTTDRASRQLHGAWEQQAGEEVLVRSDHPAGGRATTTLSSCPQRMSHARKLDDASSSSGRQTEKKMLGSRDRSSAGLQNAPAIRNSGQQFSRTRARPWVETISNFRFAEGLYYYRAKFWKVF